MSQRNETKTTMKAVRIHAFGGPEVLQYEDAPRPVAEAGEVLIRIHATRSIPRIGSSGTDLSERKHPCRSPWVSTSQE